MQNHGHGDVQSECLSWGDAAELRQPAGVRPANKRKRKTKRVPTKDSITRFGVRRSFHSSQGSRSGRVSNSTGVPDSEKSVMTQFVA